MFDDFFLQSRGYFLPINYTGGLMKSKELLDSFTKYCENNPEQRFWQALTNWSKFKFIFGCECTFLNIEEVPEDLRDVFYL